MQQVPNGDAAKDETAGTDGVLKARPESRAESFGLLHTSKLTDGTMEPRPMTDWRCAEISVWYTSLHDLA